MGDRRLQLVRVGLDPQVGRAAAGEHHVARPRQVATPVQGPPDGGVHVDRLGPGHRILALQPRERDELVDEQREPLRLGLDLAREAGDRVGILGGVLDRLGQQRDGADRRLELVRRVRHEVAAGRLDAERGRTIVRDDQGALGAQRDDADGQLQGGTPPPPLLVEVDGDELPLRAHLTHQVVQRRDPDPGTADDPERSGGLVDGHELVVATDHDAPAAERLDDHAQLGGGELAGLGDLGDAGADRLGDDQPPEQQPGDRSEEGGDDRVHAADHRPAPGRSAARRRRPRPTSRVVHATFVAAWAPVGDRSRWVA